MTILTLTRYPDIFDTFAQSVERWCPASRKMVVISGDARIERSGWECVSGRARNFVFARNFNIGLEASAPDDILACNDDVELIGPVCEHVAFVQRESGAALVSPQILGDGINNRIAQASYNLPGAWMVSKQYVPFVCAYIARAMWERVGPLNESFTGYGGEDVDWCRRAQALSLPLVVTNCVVKHGHGENTHSSSFRRVMTDAERNRHAQESLRRASKI